MNLTVAKPVSLTKLSMKVMEACPEARCSFADNGWLRISVTSCATLDVDDLCQLYAREDGWLHPDVLAVIVDAIREATR